MLFNIFAKIFFWLLRYCIWRASNVLLIMLLLLLGLENRFYLSFLWNYITLHYLNIKLTWHVPIIFRRWNKWLSLDNLWIQKVLSQESFAFDSCEETNLTKSCRVLIPILLAKTTKRTIQLPIVFRGTVSNREQIDS